MIVASGAASEAIPSAWKGELLMGLHAMSESLVREGWWRLRSRRAAMTLLAALLMSAVRPGPVWADQPKTAKLSAAQRDERRENEAVREAQKDVDAAEKNVRNAERDWQAAVQGYRRATQQRLAATTALQKTQDALEDRHGVLTGLSEARDQLRQLMAERDRLVAPLQDQLAEDPAYRAARDALAKAKADLRPDADDPDERRTTAAAYSQAQQKLRQLEEQAFAKSAAVVKQESQIVAAQKRVQTALERVEKAIADDPQLRAARSAFQKSREAEEAAEDAVRKELREVASVRQKLARAQQTLVQKQQADARDPNRPAKPGKK